MQILLGAIGVCLQVVDHGAERLVDRERDGLGDRSDDGVADRRDDELLELLLLSLLGSFRRGRERRVQRLALVGEVLHQFTPPARRRRRRSRLVVMLPCSGVEFLGSEYQLLATG